MFTGYIYIFFFYHGKFDRFQNEIKYDFGFHCQRPIFPSICCDLDNVLIENACKNTLCQLIRSADKVGISESIAHCDNKVC